MTLEYALPHRSPINKQLLPAKTCQNKPHSSLILLYSLRLLNAFKAAVQTWQNPLTSECTAIINNKTNISVGLHNDINCAALCSLNPAQNVCSVSMVTGGEVARAVPVERFLF